MPLPVPEPGRRPWRALLSVAALLVLLGCGGADLGQASSSYRQNKDLASLRVISACLKIGMPRREVERLLGEADYSPVDGQEYYASQRRDAKEADADQTLVVEYRDGKGAVTKTLRSFWLGEVGE